MGNGLCFTYAPPARLRLRRTGHYSLRITRAGFAPETVLLDRVIAENRALLAIFLGFGVGGLVDLASGAFWDQVPGRVELTLAPATDGAYP